MRWELLLGCQTLRTDKNILSRGWVAPALVAQIPFYIGCMGPDGIYAMFAGPLPHNEVGRVDFILLIS